ncbi:MAG: alpha/beta fold hydrolase, partial [Actinobacteria bacterium]|nr:alpha/beta fold hydrolase [Actinomycetota bacterium]
SFRRLAPAIGWLGPLATFRPSRGFSAQVGAILDTDDSMVAELGRITAPTLVVVGNQDILTPRADSEEIAERIPQAELVVISGAAHGLMIEHASTFNRVVRARGAVVVSLELNLDASRRRRCRNQRLARRTTVDGRRSYGHHIRQRSLERGSLRDTAHRQFDFRPRCTVLHGAIRRVRCIGARMARRGNRKRVVSRFLRTRRTPSLLRSQWHDLDHQTIGRRARREIFEHGVLARTTAEKLAGASRRRNFSRD